MNCKLTAIAAMLLFGAASASAQYMCQKQGTVYSYTSTNVEEKTSADAVVTVSEVSTAADGVVTARYRRVEKVPGNDFAEITSYSTYAYNPADNSTLYTIMSGNDFKTFLIDMVVQAAAQEGHSVSDADKAELEKNITAKGDLTMNLPATFTADQKVPNKSIKVNMGPTSMSMSLWDVKYVGYEDVETPAGKFSECLKVSYVQKSNTPAGAEKDYCISWFAKGIGEVKSVTTDKKGKVKEEVVLKAVKAQ